MIWRAFFTRSGEASGRPFAGEVFATLLPKKNRHNRQKGIKDFLESKLERTYIPESPASYKF